MHPRTVLAHGHIFKNAGSRLDWALRNSFGRAFIDHRDDQPMRRGGAEYLARFLNTNPGLRALSSHHLCYPLPETPDLRVVPVYLLRHPIERVLSVYEFERRQRASTPGAKQAKRLDIAGYVRWRLSQAANSTIGNYQVRYLSGLHARPRVAVRDAHYRLALDRLRTTLVGLVERFDPSLVLFEHELRDVFPELDLAYKAQNVNSARRAGLEHRVEELAGRLGSPLFDELQMANELDMALYREAEVVLNGRFASVAGFDALCADFESRCANLRRGRWT